MTTEPLPPASPPTRHGPSSAQVLLGALLVLVGVGWLLDVSGVGVPWRAVLPAALIAVGLATAAGAWRGRQTGLILIGLALAVVLVGAAASDWTVTFPLNSGVGDRTERPTSTADLKEYRHGVGNLNLDLTGLQLPDGTTTVRARVAVGELRVQAPEGVALQVDGRSGIGQVQALERQADGFGSRLRVRSDDFDGASRRLLLDVRVGLGQVEVDR
jgi:hypothetical protein